MTQDVLEAHGGAPGERVVVRLDGPCLDVFHETDTERWHAALVDHVGVEDHPSAVGSALVVRGERRGIRIPTSFAGAEAERLEEIARRVAAIG